MTTQDSNLYITWMDVLNLSHIQAANILGITPRRSQQLRHGDCEPSIAQRKLMYCALWNSNPPTITYEHIESRKEYEYVGGYLIKIEPKVKKYGSTSNFMRDYAAHLRKNCG